MSVADFLTIWGAHFEALVRNADWMVVFGAVLIVSAVWIFVRMARNRSSKFDFAEMFEGDNGKTSMAKFLAFIGGWTSTWVVVALAIVHELTDTMFSLYLGILVAGKVASEFVATRSTNGNGAKPEEAQSVGQVEMSIPLTVKASDVTATAATTRKPLGKYPSKGHE